MTTDTIPVRTRTQKNDHLATVAMLAGIPMIILSFMATGLLLGAWRAFVIAKLYGWFLTPLGAPLLSWWHVWGLLLIYSALKWKYEKAEPNAKTDKPWLRAAGVILASVTYFAFALLIGWLIKVWGLS